MRERDLHIDILRIIACYLVVLYHIPQVVSHKTILFSDKFSGFLYVICLPIGRCAVPLFFIISGYLLLPVKDGTFPFLKKRFLRVLIPSIVWYVLYFVFGSTFIGEHYYLSILDKSPHLWYIFAILGLYLLAPIISPWLNKASGDELLFFSVLWFISLFFPIIDTYAPIGIRYNHTGMLLDSPFKMLYYHAGYGGYFLLGGLISKYKSRIKSYYIKLSILLLLISATTTLLCLFHGVGSQTFAYLSIPTASLSFFLFITLINMRLTIGGMLASIVSNISKMTFGIYLIHLFVLENIQVVSIGGYDRLVLSILLFFISYVIVLFLSFLPYSKYIIG